YYVCCLFFFSSRRRHTRFSRDWSSDVCSSDLRDKILTVDAFASTIDYGPYDSRTVSLVGNFERVSTILFQKPFSWSVGLELVATGEREADADGNLGPRQTYFIGAVPLYAQFDKIGRASCRERVECLEIFSSIECN